MDKIDTNKLKLFDLEAAKAGRPVCTRDGRKVRIVSFDMKDKRPIVALIEENENSEYASLHYNNGSIHKDISNIDDLMMLTEKKEGWVNIYKCKEDDKMIAIISNAYATEKEALNKIDKDFENIYITTTKIEWKE